MNINIKKATVLLSDGADEVDIHTDLLSPYPPQIDPSPLTFTFKVQYDKGIQYVRDNFCIEPEVVNMRNRKCTFQESQITEVKLK